MYMATLIEDEIMRLFLLCISIIDVSIAALHVSIFVKTNSLSHCMTYLTSPFVFAVCDPKSLLFVFGMQLDYSDALIGGGFNFKNPNATQTCGCGKSFNAEM
jgi:iron-sulfur cluster assembly accessory protein